MCSQSLSRLPSYGTGEQMLSCSFRNQPLAQLKLLTPDESSIVTVCQQKLCQIPAGLSKQQSL